MEEFLQNREKLINDWIDAAINIKDQFGTAKATGYLVGEKFYNLLIELKYLRKYHNDKPEMVDGFQTLILKCQQFPFCSKPLEIGDFEFFVFVKFGGALAVHSGC